MKKLYVLLALLITLIGAKAQTSTCTVRFEYQDNITYSPFSHNVTFTAIPQSTISNGIKKICWKFGDGTSLCKEASAGTSTSTLLVATHSYWPTSSPLNTYEVCVTVEYLNGCIATFCRSIQLQSPAICSAGFSVGTVSSSAHVRTFTALPQNTDQRKPLTICWKFGDGSPVKCISYPASYTGTYTVDHLYANEGRYEVCVEIKYDGGCVAKKCSEVIIGNPSIPATCSAGIRIESVASTPLKKYLVAIPANSQQKKPLSICWKFGDGTPDVCIPYAATYTGTYAVEHTYANYSQYEACVIIKYDGGCEAKKCELVSIPSPPAVCTAGFNISSYSTNLLGRTFTAIPSNSENKKPVSICWNFGDGSLPVCQTYGAAYTGTYSVAHNYTRGGEFEVCVVIKYEGGCEAKKCQKITLPPPPPPPATCSVGIKTESVASTLLKKYFVPVLENSQHKKPMYICWKFGDGTEECKQYAGTYTGTYAIEHTYAHDGDYEVCVRVVYEGGCEAKKCELVRIHRPANECDVKINETATSINNLERKFYLGLMNDRPVEKICWTYGDGTTENCITPANPLTPNAYISSHVFPAPGTYKVCVKVWYAGGCIVQKCIEVNIRPQTGNTCGGYMTELKVAPKTFLFKGFGVQNPGDAVVSYTWSFGDGTSGNGQEVKHEYTTGGSYQVCLTIRTTSGCVTTICKRVTIETNNQPQLILTPTTISSTLHATFHSIRTETVTVRVYNSFGIMIRGPYIKSVVVGANTWDFPGMSTLSTGVYSVVVQSNTQFANALFFKQ